MLYPYFSPLCISNVNCFSKSARRGEGALDFRKTLQNESNELSSTMSSWTLFLSTFIIFIVYTREGVVRSESAVWQNWARRIEFCCRQHCLIWSLSPRTHRTISRCPCLICDECLVRSVRAASKREHSLFVNQLLLFNVCLLFFPKPSDCADWLCFKCTDCVRPRSLLLLFLLRVISFRLIVTYFNYENRRV